MIFIMVNDYFTTEPVIISRPSNDTTAEPIDSCNSFIGSQTPGLPAANSVICWRLDGVRQLMRLCFSRGGDMVNE